MKASAWHSPYSMMIRSNLTVKQLVMVVLNISHWMMMDGHGWLWTATSKRPRRFKAYFQKFAKILYPWECGGSLRWSIGRIWSFWPSLTKPMQIVLKAGEAGRLSIVSWRTWRLKRKAISTDDGEIQAMVDGEDANFRTRFLWCQRNGCLCQTDLLKDANYMERTVVVAVMPSTRMRAPSWASAMWGGLSTARWQRIPHLDQWWLESFRCPHEERQIMWSWLESVCQKLDVEIDLRPELHPVREEGQEAWTGSCFTNETALFHDSVSRKSFWFPNGVISREEFWSNATVTFALADPLMIIRTGGPCRPWAPRAVKRFPAP